MAWDINSHAWVEHARMAWTQTSSITRAELDVLGIRSIRILTMQSWFLFGLHLPRECCVIQLINAIKSTHIMLIIFPHKEIQLQYTYMRNSKYGVIPKRLFLFTQSFHKIQLQRASKFTCPPCDIARYISQKYTKKTWLNFDTYSIF